MGVLRGLLDRLGGILRPLGGILGPHGRILVPLGPSWRPLGGVLGLQNPWEELHAAPVAGTQRPLQDFLRIIFGYYYVYPTYILRKRMFGRIREGKEDEQEG